MEALKWLLRVCLFVALASPIFGEAAASAYEKEIKPVLKERCYACHGALKQKAGLRVDTVAFIKEANVIASGDPEKSELVQRIRSNDEEERMPPEGHALTQVEVKAITDWITAGALAPKGNVRRMIRWSIGHFKKSSVPTSRRSTGISHPVDALLAAKQKDRGIIPVAAVDRKLAIRRLYLDLIGLPPTRGQLEDNRPWEAIVDELLASPQPRRALGSTLDGCVALLGLVWARRTASLFAEASLALARLDRGVSQ